MSEPSLFWFRTRQPLLEEWGYTVGLWHLVRRSRLSIVVIGISAEGRPRVLASGALSELPATRVPLVLLNSSDCEFLGPFAPEGLLAPGNWMSRPFKTQNRPLQAA